jgi:5S rRNA maturation endonuclease (ribonuclease M5)
MENFFNQITNFYNHPLFIIVGGVTVTLAFLAFIYRLACWAFGITPIVFRLGIALWQRKVAIFGNVEIFQSLRDSLVDSNIFKKKNIIHISSDNIDKAKDQTIFLVDWDTFGDKIEQVFSCRKNHQTAIVIYAKPASIPLDKMNDIANRANTVVVNFRGRHLNDILTSLITTSYDRN